jgi:hypothetical protein
MRIDELNSKLSLLNEDTHKETHDHLTKFGWEFAGAKKTAPLVSTHIYRHTKHPNHEIHVTNLSGNAFHYEKTKNDAGYHQEIKTVVPHGKIKTYLEELHKEEKR